MSFIELGPDTSQPNHVRAFAQRRDVHAAWQALNGAIKANMDLRRYELATLAAARRLRSSYCSLAHASVLVDQDVMAPEAVRAAYAERAGLDEVDVAVMELAAKVAGDATSVTQADVDRLRALGLSEAEVMDVVLAATARCFYSKTLDALGVQPDASYAEMEPGLRDTLTVGRPIASSA